MRLADMALFAAKAQGRNTYRVFDPGMEDAARRRMVLMADLHAAVAGGQLSLQYQPLVDFGSTRVAGAEALLRWRHPTRGFVPPAEFIPLAEESGLIVEIGRWVLERACETACGWPSHMRVAVNLSAIQFASPTFTDELCVVLEESGLPPHRLELEITESLLIHDQKAAVATLDRLHAMGVRVALDDFGTGYSSLAYLKRFPFDALKIDGAFVRSLDDDGASSAVVRAIVDLARALRMGVTAEGIETPQQFRALRDLGCTEGQGYFCGRPMESDALRSLIAGGPVLVGRHSAA